MSAQPDAPYVALKRLWTTLPAGPYTEEELRTAIIEAAALYVGDWAGSDGRRTLLQQLGALTVTNENGQTTWHRSAEFPPYVDRGPGSAAHNEWLAQQAQRERERFERDKRIQREHQAVLDRPIRDAEDREWNRRVATYVAPQLDALRDEISDLKRQLGLTTDAADRPHDDTIHGDQGVHA
jgi:hypothetical protein